MSSLLRYLSFRVLREQCTAIGRDDFVILVEDNQCWNACKEKHLLLKPYQTSKPLFIVPNGTTKQLLRSAQNYRTCPDAIHWYLDAFLSVRVKRKVNENLPSQCVWRNLLMLVNCSEYHTRR